MDEKISIDDFKKLDIRVGEIRSAGKIEGTDKLLRLIVSFGPSAALAMEDREEERQIVSGIAEYYPDPGTLIGKKVAFAYNLEPRTIRGQESQGMILGVSGEDGSFSLLETSGVPSGAKVR